MPATATQPTVGNLSGTPVLFYPVPTPWPSAPGCEKYLYRALMETTMVAYDPRAVVAGANPEASSCYVPQHSAWLGQNPNTTPSTALGPTFVCPEAWSAVHSTVLKSNSAGETQFTYCCPPKFTLAALQPPTDRYYIQCTSTVEPGITLSYKTFIGTEVPISDGGVGEASKQAIITFAPTETVVASSPETIYAFPVNGYNIITRDAGSGSTHTGTLSHTTPTASTGDTPAQTDGAAGGAAGDTAGGGSAGGGSSSPGLSPAAIAGTVVGAVLGLGLMALAAFFIRRRYPRSAAAAAGATHSDRPDAAAAAAAWGEGGGGQPGDDYHAYQKHPQHGAPSFVNEAPSEAYAHELPHAGVYAHELPVPAK